MNPLKKTEFAPIFGDNRKVEVGIEADTTVVRVYDWIEGLGWSCQKTLKLDDRMVDDLHRALSAVRCRAKARSADNGTGNVIDFPVVK